MARKQIVITEDDLDGGPATHTVQFSIDGQCYEIDLNTRNADALRLALDPYVRHGRKAAGRTNTRGTRGTRNLADYLTDVRAWARDQGHDVSSRGRVPAAILDAYATAH